MLGLQVPVCTVLGANIGWCFGYAVGCAETATAFKVIALHIARPVLSCLQAVAGFGLARIQIGLTRARLR